MEEKKNREKEKEENIWRRDLQKLSRILRDLDFGFGRKTFANFWRVSVSENLVLEKSLGFDFGESGLGKKASVSENKGSGFQAAWPQKLFLIFSDILVDIVDQP